MGMDFTGRSADVSMTVEGLFLLVEVAKLYGWQPTGTVMIDEYQYDRPVLKWVSTRRSPRRNVSLIFTGKPTSATTGRSLPTPTPKGLPKHFAKH